MGGEGGRENLSGDVFHGLRIDWSVLIVQPSSLGLGPFQHGGLPCWHSSGNTEFQVYECRLCARP